MPRPSPMAPRRPVLALDVDGTFGFCNDAEAAILAEALHGAATADDTFSDRGLRAFAAFGADLGAFLSPWTEVLRADAVLVAGGIAGAFALFGPALEAALAIPARAGDLGVAAGLIGGAHAMNGGVGRVALNVG